MPFKPSGVAPYHRQQAASPQPSPAAGAPDILLMVLAAMSLWVLIVWALARYL
jgi:hypothetical protein